MIAESLFINTSTILAEDCKTHEDDHRDDDQVGDIDLPPPILLMAIICDMQMSATRYKSVASNAMNQGVALPSCLCTRLPKF